jgi:hypothetical protein
MPGLLRIGPGRYRWQELAREGPYVEGIKNPQAVLKEEEITDG